MAGALVIEQGFNGAGIPFVKCAMMETCGMQAKGQAASA
ncbi:MAG: hypothetical protein RLZZ282_706 [Verrucomicrobiota bacterium]